MARKNLDHYLNPEQKVLLGKVKQASEQLRHAREVAEIEVRALITERLEEAEANRNAKVREALARGAKPASIKRAMGTSDHATYQAIVRGFNPTLYAADVPSFELDPETMTGVLNWLEWEGVRTDGPWSIMFHEDYPGARKWLVNWDSKEYPDLDELITKTSDWVLFDQLNEAVTTEMRSK